jgi:hypothetical protein
MTLQFRFVLSLMGLVLLLAACDTSEDDNLLNPPLPDSSRVRVVNLVDEPISVTFANYPITTALAPQSISDYQKFLFTGQASLIVARESRRDTLRSQTLSSGSRVTYVVMGDRTHNAILPQQTGSIDQADLLQRRMARIYFINAIPDSTAAYLLRRGCISGDTLFRPIAARTSGSFVETDATSLSLYLFGGKDTALPATTAHLDLTPGTVTYLIAAVNNGRKVLYAVSGSASGSNSPLQEVAAETRTTANVTVLNATADANPITALIKGGATVATDLPPLQISPAASVDACVNPLGDSLVVSSNGSAPATAPIRLAVGTRSLVAVYGTTASPRVLLLGQDLSSPASGKIYVRGVNLSTVLPSASVAIGAGAPSGIAEGYRPFGTLPTGGQSSYTEMPEGNYPFLLRNATTGEFVTAGIEQLTSGYYTLFVVDHSGFPELRLLRDDQVGGVLSDLAKAGTLATFFNMMSDAEATFTIGPLQLPPIAYSYTVSTVLPEGTTTVSSNAGQTTIDPSAGSYMIGATGSSGNRQLIAFKSPVAPPPVGQAVIRFVNGVPDVPQMNIYVGTQAVPPITADFGTPTAQFQQDERKYSFIVTRPGDTTTLARLDGVELIRQHSYVLVIGPKRAGAPDNGLQYGMLMLQE